MLNGQAVMVKMSEAEKNLAWEAAEQAKRHQREFGTDAVAFTAPMMPPPLPGMPGGAPLMAPAVASGPARLALSNLPTTITGARCWLAGLGGAAGQGPQTRWWADIVLSIALLPQLAISCCAYLHLPTPSLLPALPCLPALQRTTCGPSSSPLAPSTS